MTKYWTAKLIEQKPKTKVYAIISRGYGDQLGIVKWYAPWRQYCFFPSEETIWSRSCLAEINRFIEDLMEERKD